MNGRAAPARFFMQSSYSVCFISWMRPKNEKDSHNRIPITEELLKRMLDASPVASFAFDGDRRVIFANRFARDQMKMIEGMEIGAAEARHFEDHRYYDEEGDLLAYPKESAVERALRGEETHDLVIEHRNIRDRKHQWLRINCVPFFDKDGAFSYGVISYQDISARKAREERFNFLLNTIKILSVTADFEERLKEKARLAVPSLADWCAIDIANDDGTTTRKALIHRDPKRLEWIKEVEKKYPRDPRVESGPERVIRTGTAEFMPHLSPALIDELLDKLPIEVSDEMRADVHSLQLTSTITLPIMGKGNKVYGVMSLAYAESGRQYTPEDFDFFKQYAQHLAVLLENARLYDEISRREAGKDAFLASLSHELRNPLAPIKSALELLRIQNRDPLLMGEIDIVHHQFDHMAKLLNDLLDTTRYISGKFTLDKEPLELSKVTRTVVDAMQPIAEKAGIGLRVSYHSEPLTFLGDRTRLEQAITNIISNAIKFTPRGGIIRIDHTLEGDTIRLTISDTGVGITADEMRHIFEPYYQGERMRAGNTGLGVGLRLVHEIVRLHGGTIVAESEGPGKGSRFVISLPKESAAPAVPERLLDAPLARNERRILVVDDNHAAADSLVRLLNALGSAAKAFYSAYEVVEYLKDHEADIVFLDVGMPDMDGYMLVKLLREQGHEHLPIIAITGYGLEEDKKRAIEAGFTAHLTKPIGVKEINQILSEITS